MAFHGLDGDGLNYFVTKLLSIRKGNLATLMKHKLSRPQISNGNKWLITFSDVQDQIFKKQFLVGFEFLYDTPKLKKSIMEIVFSTS